MGKSFAFPPLNPAAQKLVAPGGAENLMPLSFVRNDNNV
jgi:hypothetical protein